jgi:hypothetical protein
MAGWVRLRWSRAVSEDVTSSRATGDRAGRWHVAFAAIARLKTCEADRPEDWVEKINPACTSQTFNACGYCAAESRERQAVFRCRACGYADHADANAARNIAVGRTVTARGDRPVGGPVDREPHLVFSSA